MHGIFSHFKGTNAFLMDLFFERGWCRSLGENVWKSSKDGKTLHKTREIVEEKMKWNMFLTVNVNISISLFVRKPHLEKQL
jgi:hypothetical protein